MTMLTSTALFPAATPAVSTPATDLLSLLHQYSSLHISADDHLKSSLWNITRARRGGAGGFGGVEYSADDVREELRARAMLEWKDGGVDEDGEPGLVGEASSDGDSENDGGTLPSSGGGGFVLHLDAMRAASLRKRDAVARESRERDETFVAADEGENEGLRRRRRGDAAAGASSPEDESRTNGEWTTEEPVPAVCDEERLRDADPLNLFGVPPPALRAAQAESRGALAYYVEVANLAREIAKITNREGAESRED